VPLSEAAAAVRIEDAVAGATTTLAAAGCETPRLDAELLLAHALERERAHLVVAAREPLASAAARRFEALVKRRAAREPVAYITGRRDFRRISLRVDRRALIPRPETELLVDVGLSLARGARVADVGTGSGAVALALKDERPDLSIVGLDVSHGALALARENAARLRLDVRFEAADLLDGADYDAVLANLPYVADGAELPPEISSYEPAGALFAGVDGLDVIRRLLARSGEIPLVALEVGFDQAADVAALLAGAGFGSVQRLRDLAGHERVLVGRR
jgi:release factor glutamine methyltransferase